MHFPFQNANRLKPLPLLLLGVIAYGAAFPPLEWAPMAWLAPVVWLVLLRGCTWRARFWRMFFAGYLGSALVVHWLTALFSTMALFLWAIPALYFGLWGALAGIFGLPGDQSAPSYPASRRLYPVWFRIVWPAVAWVGIEYFRCELAPLAFSFGGLGYSQANVAGFFIASGVGVYGLSFLMVLLAALGIEVWFNGAVRRRAPALGVVAVAVIVALVVPPADDVGVADERILGRALLQQLSQDDDIGGRAALAPRDVTGRLDLVVWPELTYTNDPRLPESKWFLDMMHGEASQTNWGAIFGAIAYSGDASLPAATYYNSAFLLGPNGQILDRAGKNQPVQLLADGVPAPDVVIMEMGAGAPGEPDLRAGVGVCYDACFQRFPRRMISRGADFLVFPTMNLENWGKIQHRQHQRMFQMRAAETGRTVLVAAVSGPTFAAAPGGAVASPLAEFHKTDTVITDITAPRQTLFNLAGWLVGPLGVGLVALGISWRAIESLLVRWRR